MEQSTFTLTALMENRPGVLNRVVSLFRRRSFNLDSLTVGRTERDEISRMTLVLEGTASDAKRVETELAKLVQVIRVEQLNDTPHVARDLALIKVAVTSENRQELRDLCEIFRARVIDVASGQTIARGFAMPHSPRIHDGRLWLLDSGRGTLLQLDPSSGQANVVARFPGYTRGLAIHGHLAFVGLSRIRETSTFGGVPIAEQRERLKCGVAVVDLQRGQLVGQFEFKSGVEEIFDVTILPDTRMAAMRGPFAMDDGDPTIWVVPDPVPPPDAGG